MSKPDFRVTYCCEYCNHAIPGAAELIKERDQLKQELKIQDDANEILTRQLAERDAEIEKLRFDMVDLLKRNRNQADTIMKLSVAAYRSLGDQRSEMMCDPFEAMQKLEARAKHAGKGEGV